MVSPDVNSDVFKSVKARTLDEKLLSLVDKLSGKFSTQGNFIIINQRSSHFPYTDNYSGARDEFNVFGEKTEVDAYDNSIVYDDFIVASLIKSLNRKLKGDSLFIITSDHGQLFGERGLYKHNHLVPECAYVPMVFYSRDKRILDRISNIATDRAMTHYECAKLILMLMGFDVNNPNEKDGEFYINGSNIYLDFAFIRLKKKGDKIAFDKRAFITR